MTHSVEVTCNKTDDVAYGFVLQASSDAINSQSASFSSKASSPVPVHIHADASGEPSVSTNVQTSDLAPSPTSSQNAGWGRSPQQPEKATDDDMTQVGV